MYFQMSNHSKVKEMFQCLKLNGRKAKDEEKNIFNIQCSINTYGFSCLRDMLKIPKKKSLPYSFKSIEIVIYIVFYNIIMCALSRTLTSP